MKFKKMTLTISIIILFLFLLTTTVFADDYKKIKEDWFKHDEVSQIGNDLYRFFINYNHPLFIDEGIPETLLLNKNGKNIAILTLNSCSFDDDFKYCYEDYSYDKSTFGEVRIDGKLNFIEFPGVKVGIYELKEPITPSYSASVSSTISGNKFVFEEQQANITLKNTGDLSLTGSEIRISAPANVSLTSRGDFMQVSNNLRKSLILPKEDDKELTFNYKVLSSGKKDFTYKIIKDGEEIKTGSFSVTGIVPHSIKISNPSTSDIRQVQDLAVLVENKNPKKELIVKELIVIGSPYIQYLENEGLSSFRMGSFSAHEVEIGPGEEKTFSLKYMPFFAREYDFEISGIVEQLGGEHSFFEEKKLDVKSEGLSAGLLFSRKKISLGASTNLVLTIKNDHSTLSFNNLEIKIESSLFNETKTLNTIRSGEEVELINKEITPPQISSSKEYEAKVIITYSDASGSSQSLTLSDSFKIHNTSLVRITQSVSPKKVSAGDEIIVRTRVRNDIDNNLRNIKLKDSFSQNVDVITGRQSFDSSFSSGQEREAYLYKIRIPERPTSDELEIRTLVEIPSIDYKQLETTIVKIDGEIFWDEAEDLEEISDETTGKSEDVENDEEFKEDIDEVQKQETRDENEKVGFFRKVLRGIENFFGNIF